MMNRELSQCLQSAHWKSALRAHFYVLELFSGNGTIAILMSRILDGCLYETIDVDDDCMASIKIDVLDWQKKNMSDKLKNKYKRLRPVIWASPPCQHYSRVKTTGKRNLEMADQYVAMIQTIAKELNAAMVFVENPATGHLKDRDVISFMPHNFVVDYCRYGGELMKPTMIWCSHDLAEVGFIPKTCPGTLECGSTFFNRHSNKVVHVGEFETTAYMQRIAVPSQLIVALMRAAVLILEREAHHEIVTPPPRRRK